MKTHQVAGGGGVQLHVVEAGKPSGRPILFIHGGSQSWLTWSRQLDSELARDHRLVAMDLRGHGLSDKPRDAYGDSRLWADDVAGIIDALNLDRPVLSGWSVRPACHPGLSAALRRGPYRRDPLRRRHYETRERRGDVRHHFGVAESCAGPLRDRRRRSVRSLESLLRLCFFEQPSASDLYLMLGYNVSVPPYVRQGLFSRAFDNDDLLPRIRKPALITHGAKDAVVKPEVVDQHKASLAHAQIHIMPNVGHAAFWEDSAAFNQRLRAFVETCSSVTTATRAIV